MQKLIIGNRFVGEEYEPFIVAEMSGNHNQSLHRALQIVDAAAQAGAHALKLQTYTADTMTIDKKDGEFVIDDPKSLWYGKNLYDLYKEAHTPWEWHKPIFDRCKALGMICFSTPFDETAVDFLETLNVPCYKIASFENTDTELLAKVAKTGKPIIISIGMASLSDLQLMVDTIRTHGGKNFILLKCTSTYPALPSAANLRTIPHLRDMFGCQVGLSDHTLGVGTAIASIALGATLIEKHFTLSRSEGGVDSAFSLEPKDIKTLVEETKRAWESLGKVFYGPDKTEKNAVMAKRSLYVIKDLKQGDKITKDNTRAIRPGLGLPVKYYNSVLGKIVTRDIRRGTPMTWDILR